MSIELRLFDPPPKVGDDIKVDEIAPLLRESRCRTVVLNEGAYELQMPFMVGFKKKVVVFEDGRGLFRLIPLDPSGQVIDQEDNQEVKRKAGGTQYRIPEDLDVILLEETEEDSFNRYIHGLLVHFD